MTEIDDAMAPFVEAEIKEHQADCFRSSTRSSRSSSCQSSLSSLEGRRAGFGAKISRHMCSTFWII
jgi:hypothetical protein